jgi:hypothetical protein
MTQPGSKELPEDNAPGARVEVRAGVKPHRWSIAAARTASMEH